MITKTALIGFTKGLNNCFFLLRHPRISTFQVPWDKRYGGGTRDGSHKVESLSIARRGSTPVSFKLIWELEIELSEILGT
jgi:hypothetical protein